MGWILKPFSYAGLAMNYLMITSKMLGGKKRKKIVLGIKYISTNNDAILFSKLSGDSKGKIHMEGKHCWEGEVLF